MAAPLHEHPDPPALAAEKATLRRMAMAARATLRHEGAGEALASTVLTHCLPPPGALIGGFWPMGDEIDIRPLMYCLAGRGHAFALPVTPRRGFPLVFRRWAPGEPLVPGRFGTSVPPDTAEEVKPDEEPEEQGHREEKPERFVGVSLRARGHGALNSDEDPSVAGCFSS